MTLRQRYGGFPRRASALPAQRCDRTPAQTYLWVFMWAAACGARASRP